MTLETWCGNCQNPEPVRILISSDVVADLLIQQSILRLSREDAEAFLRENESFASALSHEDRIAYAQEKFHALLRERLTNMSDFVEAYPASARGAALLASVRQAILLDIHVAAMAELSEETELVRITAPPGQLMRMILDPIGSTLRKQLHVRRGGARASKTSLPPQTDAIWSDFVRRTDEATPAWVAAKSSEQAPSLGHLPEKHRTKLQKAFYQKKLGPHFLSLLQAGAELSLWDASRDALPHENLAKRYRAHRKYT